MRITFLLEMSYSILYEILVLPYEILTALIVPDFRMHMIQFHHVKCSLISDCA